MTQSKKGFIYVVLSSLGYALTGIISKFLITDGLPPMLTLVLRTIICTILLGFLVLMVKKEKISIAKKDIKTFIILGFVLFVYSAGYFLSLVYLDVSIAVVLLYTYPAMLVAASIFVYKEKPTKVTLTAMILTFLGILLTLGIFSADLGKLSLPGILLVLSAAAGIAIYAIFVKNLSSSYSGLAINFCCFTVTSLLYCLTLPFCLPEQIPSAMDFLSILILAIPYTLAFIFYAWGLQYLPPSKVGIVGSMEPVFSITMAAAFLGESIAPMQGFGVILVLTAIALLELFPKK